MAEPSDYVPGATEARLKALSRHAAALEAQLGLTRSQVAQLVEQREQDVRKALDALRVAVGATHGLSPAVMAELGSAIDRFSRTLARRGASSGGRSAAPSRFADACAEFHGDLATMLARAGGRVERALLRARRRYERALDAFEVEARVADACRRLTSGYRGRTVIRRRELLAQVRSLSAQLEERRARLAEQRVRSATLWRELDASLRRSVEAVGAELERLLL